MTTTRVETMPATWDDARDTPFFRITSRLFTSEFCFGAGVLLASYDDSLGTLDPAAATAPRTATATPATTHTRAHPDRGLAPARVRHPR